LEVPTLVNETILIAGYGSLLSGHGMLTVRRNGKSRLVARDAFPIAIRNARRGLAKPSSHGHYLAMDLEPIRPDEPIEARVGLERDTGEIGALGLVFDRRWAEMIARREEYSPEKFLELLAIADRAGQPIGRFLLEMARSVRFNLLAYRRELFKLLGYTSPGYIFHPLPLDDGRVALVAIGSGFEGSGDPAVQSWRNQYGIARPLSLPQALALSHFKVDRTGQIGYFVECLLGGLHGLGTADLMHGLDLTLSWGSELARMFAGAAADELGHFLAATSLSPDRYRALFGAASVPELRPLLSAALG
jgi:hypothetical protein